MTSARREAVVVFSGGTDSTCAAALAAAENDRVHLLTFFERATASTARLSPNVAKLRERFKNVEFTAQLLSVDPLVRHYSYEGYFKMVREHGALALSTPGFSSLSWHTRTILYCLEHGVKNASDGLTRELMHFPGHMTEVIEHFRALYAHFGVEYTNPVRDWEVPADQQFIDQVIVNTHGGDYLLGEDNVLRRTTGRYLHDLGILPAPNVKGTKLDRLMQQEMQRNGVDIRIRCDVEKIHCDGGRVRSVEVGGRTIKTKAVVSNANLKQTIFGLVGEEYFDRQFVEDARAVRLNNSSTQVYMGLKPDERIDESTGDLLFSSTAPLFRTELLLSRDITSRTFSFYYPRTRPEGRPRCLIVSSTNARYEDWADLPKEEYEASKKDLIETTLDALDKYVPNIRERIDHAEASTPLTFKHYTQHVAGASFGTKFEGLKVSFDVPKQISGLYHAGSVGIIMSGWLGAMNYGRMVAGDVDNLLATNASRSTAEVGS